MAMSFGNCPTLALAVLAALSLSNLSTSASAFAFTSMTKEELVEKFISQDGSVELSNINASPHIHNCTRYYTGGHDMGYAWLNDDNVTLTDVHLLPDEGIMLSSGDPLDFEHNDADWQTTAWGDWNETLYYDEDLASAINDTGVKDACFLEFDFKCSGEGYVPQVSFNYVFGSEEYHEYVNSSYNDAFAFLLNEVNIAKLPSTESDSEVVSINNVNLQLNRQYFHGNDPSCDAGICMVYPQIEADGFTVILTALGAPHQNPDQTNKIKIVVGDVGDAILDSWVLLEGASFSCVPVSTSGPTGSKSGKGTPTTMPSSSSKSGKSHQSAQPSSMSSESAQPSSEPSLSVAPSVSDEPSSIKPSPISGKSGKSSGPPTNTNMPSSSNKAGKSRQSAQPSPSIVPSESAQPSSSSGPSLSLAPSPSSSSKSGKSHQSAQPSIVSSESAQPSSEPSLSVAPSVSDEPSSIKPSPISGKSGKSSGPPTNTNMPSSSNKSKSGKGKSRQSATNGVGTIDAHGSEGGKLEDPSMMPPRPRPRPSIRRPSNSNSGNANPSSSPSAIAMPSGKSVKASTRSAAQSVLDAADMPESSAIIAGSRSWGSGSKSGNTEAPTAGPSSSSSSMPSPSPSAMPSSKPSFKPSSTPSSSPSAMPSGKSGKASARSVALSGLGTNPMAKAKAEGEGEGFGIAAAHSSGPGSKSEKM